MAFRPSKFHEGLIPEQFSFITGINETVEEKTLIRPHTRYIMAATDYADGISFRKLGLSTDGMGYGRLPFDDTVFASGYGRGMGIFQLYGGANYFASYFATPFPTGSPYASTSVNELAQWSFTGTKTSLATLTGPTNNPVNTQLPCHVFANYLDIITDNQFLNAIWNLSGTITNAPLIQQPTAPALAVSSTNPLAYISQFGSQGNPFNGPEWIALDSSGNIFVTDTVNNLIYKFNPSGVQQTFSVTGVTLTGPTGICIDSGNNVYVVNNHTSTSIIKLNSSGAFQLSFTGGDFRESQIGLCVDSSNNVYSFQGIVSAGFHQIQKFNSSGVFQSGYNSNGGAFPSGGGCVDSSGNIYVVTTVGVQKLNSSGVFQSNFTGYTFQDPLGITVDGSGNFYVADGGTNNCIVIFNSSGVFQNTIGSSGSGNGQFNSPFGLVYLSGSPSNLYIVDSGNFRIQDFSTGVGTLTGDYAYCITLVDVYGNESQPSVLAPINGLSAQNVQLTITPGLNVTLAVWKTIRIYRTVSNGSTPITASQNPTFWHVPGLDIPITAAITYTVIDSIPDTSISPSVSGTTIADNYTLQGESAVINASYANGALQTLAVGSVPKFITAWNGQTWGANWSVAFGSGTVPAGNYPI